MSLEKQKTVTSLRVGASPAKSIHTPSSNDSFRKSGFKSKSVIRSMRSRLIPTTVLDKPSPSEIRVYNDAGEDVTPKPLLQVDRHSAKGQPSVVVAESSGGTPTNMSQSSFYQTGTMAAAGGTTAGPFTRSVFSGSVLSGRSTDLFSDDMSDSPLDGSSTWMDMKVEYKRDEVAEALTEGDLEGPVEITLTETDMISMLELPVKSVMSSTAEGKIVAESNTQYQELVKGGKAGNSDRYTDRGMNTFNDPPKNKSTLTAAITHRECAVQASESDIFDTNNGLEKGVDQKIANPDEDLILFTSSEGATTDVTLKPDEGKDAGNVEARPADIPLSNRISAEGGREATTVSSMAIGESMFGGKDSCEPTKENVIDISLEEERILKSDSLKRHLVIMERVINLNTYQPKLAAYRNFPNLSVEAEPQPPLEADKAKVTTKSSQKIETIHDLGPSLDRLWSYQCPLTKGRNVSCIAWNRVNPNLVAVGYGQFEYSKQKSGLVCCWSVKNPEYPERVYETQAGVLSVDFSQSHPSLLAVGMYTGTITIYNVALLSKEPILDSLEASGKHIGPVWQLCWIEKERGKGEERTEVLVSISADGRVTQWAIRKGFESYDLIKLKRVMTRQSGQGKQKKSEAYISKYASGLCFNFSAKDSNIYLAGTEDGYIHKCSCSYNEQYLDSYQGHTGPVYGVSWSPYDDNIFLSCSADWSIRLWHQERLQPVLNLFSSTKAVHSVSWSPKSSTVFACVNEGALEVWDLSQNTLDPILQNTPSAVDIKLSSVSFSRNSDCLLVGDSEGQVTVYQLRGMPMIHADQVEALHQVINFSLASQLNS